MEFIQKDELGLERTYYVISNLEYENEEYIIYSDLLKDKETNKEFRILVGQIEEGKVIRTSKDIETKVKTFFETLENNYKNRIKELI